MSKRVYAPYAMNTATRLTQYAATRNLRAYAINASTRLRNERDYAMNAYAMNASTQ